MPMTLDSPAFVQEAAIPQRYSLDGENLSPPVRWHGAPATARSYVLVVEDPDAPSGTFGHWGIFNIPATQHDLPEGAGSRESNGRRIVTNDFGHRRYDGPRPPAGHGMHHYHFRLAALDVPTLEVPANSTVETLWNSAKAHIVAQAELVGTYER